MVHITLMHVFLKKINDSIETIPDMQDGYRNDDLSRKRNLSKADK